MLNGSRAEPVTDAVRSSSPFPSNYPLTDRSSNLHEQRHIVSCRNRPGKLHFYGGVSWRCPFDLILLTNADARPRWQPRGVSHRAAQHLAIVRPRLHAAERTSNWFGAFNFTKITGTRGRETQVPLMVIIYGNGTGRSVGRVKHPRRRFIIQPAEAPAQRNREWERERERKREIFAGRSLPRT